MSPKSVSELFKRIFPRNKQLESSNTFSVTNHPTIPEAPNEDIDVNSIMEDKDVDPSEVMLPNEGRISDCFDIKPFSLEAIEGIGAYGSFYQNNKNTKATLPSRLARALDDMLVKMKRSKHDTKNTEADGHTEVAGKQVQNDITISTMLGRMPNGPIDDISATNTPIYANNSRTFPLSVSVTSGRAAFPGAIETALSAVSLPTPVVNSDAATMAYSMPASATSASTTMRFPSFNEMVSTSAAAPRNPLSAAPRMNSTPNLLNSMPVSTEFPAQTPPSLVSAPILPKLVVDTAYGESEQAAVIDATPTTSMSVVPPTMGSCTPTGMPAVSQPAMSSLSTVAAFMPMQYDTLEKPQVDSTPTQPWASSGALIPTVDMESANIGAESMNPVINTVTESTLANSTMDEGVSTNNQLTIFTQPDNVMPADSSGINRGESSNENAPAIALTTEEPKIGSVNLLMEVTRTMKSPLAAKKMGMTLKRLRSIFKGQPQRREHEDMYAKAMLDKDIADLGVPAQTPFYNRFAKYSGVMSNAIVRPLTPDLSPVAYDLRTTCNQLFFGRW